MLYKYDNAIAKNLEESFDTSSRATPIVKVIDGGEESIQSLIAQIQNDEIEFPLVVLSRNPSTPIDNSRTNFTRMHRGVATVMDKETNMLYHEKVIPIKLGYEILVLATNTADRDELVRELMFKYTDMFFIGFDLPYESDRKARFGIVLDSDKEIETKSGSVEYLQGGQLYQAIVPLEIQGAVLLSYTPVKLKRLSNEVEIEAQPNEP